MSYLKLIRKAKEGDKFCLIKKNGRKECVVVAKRRRGRGLGELGARGENLKRAWAFVNKHFPKSRYSGSQRRKALVLYLRGKSLSEIKRAI